MTDKTIKLGRFKRSFERGHETGSGVFDTGCADAVYQCVFDGLQIAAPQPVIVVKVGIAERLASGGSRAMALRAVDLEGRTSSGYCLSEKFAVLRQAFDRYPRQLFAHSCARLIDHAHLFGEFSAAGPAKHAFRRFVDQRPGWIKNDVDHTPDDRQV